MAPLPISPASLIRRIGWTLHDADGINDKGQIDWQEYAFLLTPDSNAPVTLILLGTGLLALGGLRRRMKL